MSIEDYREKRKLQNDSIKKRLRSGEVIWLSSNGMFEGSVRQELIEGVVDTKKKKRKRIQHSGSLLSKRRTPKVESLKTTGLRILKALAKKAEETITPKKKIAPPKQKKGNKLYLHYNELAMSINQKIQSHNVKSLGRAKEIYRSRAGLCQRLKDEKNIVKAFWVDQNLKEHEIKLIHPIAA